MQKSVFHVERVHPEISNYWQQELSVQHFLVKKPTTPEQKTLLHKQILTKMLLNHENFGVKGVTKDHFKNDPEFMARI